MDQTKTPLPSADRLASLPAAAAFLREMQARTSPGRPLYGLAGQAAETIDQVRRELARMESEAAMNAAAPWIGASSREGR